MSEQQTYQEGDEITLKELILKLQEYYREVIRNWKLLFAFCISIAALMLYIAWTSPTLYPTKLTFMINQDDGNSMGGVNAILGQIGLGGGRGKYNYDKILELSRSQKIVQSVLFEKAVVNGQSDYLANHLIRVYDYHDSWAEDTTGLKGFLFGPESLKLVGKAERRALKSLYGRIVGNVNVKGIMATSYSEDSGVMSLRAESESEELSIELVTKIYEELSEFYVSKTTERQAKTFDIVNEKVDSVKTAMEQTEYALAKFEDTNRNVFSRQTLLQRFRLERDRQMYVMMYKKAVENREIADFSLKNSMPYVQIIDAPFAPIEGVRESKFKALIIGGFLGGILAVLFIVGRKVIRDTMAAA